jgi:hypothetical protein
MAPDPRPTGRQRPVERFKPTSGMILGYVGVSAAVFTVGYVAWTVHTVTGLQVALGAAFFGVVVWTTQLRPRATAYPRHVVLKNSLRDAHVPLASVDEVAIGQTLTLWVGDRRFVCIGIGNSFREEIRSRRRQEQSLGTSRMGELTIRAERANNDERAMSYQTFVVTRLEELVAQAKKEAQPGEPDRPPRTVLAWPEVAGLVLTGAAFLVAFFL